MIDFLLKLHLPICEIWCEESFNFFACLFILLFTDVWNFLEQK